jgi:hypothetical protein
MPPYPQTEERTLCISVNIPKKHKTNYALGDDTPGTYFATVKLYVVYSVHC